MWRRAPIFALLLLAVAHETNGSACVWKVTAPNGGTLYLGGSIHHMRASDYPLPRQYNQAFDASNRLAFETDLTEMNNNEKLILKNAEYPKGDSLKKHVDPRTYDYVRRVFRILGVPEEKFSKYRPWFLVHSLTSPVVKLIAPEPGIEDHLAKRARAAGKKTEGLTSMADHLSVMSGLNDKQAEILLLMTFIPSEGGGDKPEQLIRAWRRGDVDHIAKETHASLSVFPSFEERLLGARNRAWIPKIEEYMRSGKTYFVVVGSAHLGGNDGLISLLRGRGYKIEQQ